MAIKFHPDKCNHSKAVDAFKKINAANNILSDPSKKRIYDQNKHADIFSNKQQHGHSPDDFCFIKS